MAPSGKIGEEAIQVWLNTLISILGGSISWTFTQWILIKSIYLFCNEWNNRRISR